MPIVTEQIGPCFAAEARGVDLRHPLSHDDAAAIHAGMDRYAVLVFHDQEIDDAQQLAFTRSLGEIEHAIGTSPCAGRASCAAARRSPTFPTSIKDEKTFARGRPAARCSASATGSGIPTARSR